MTSTRARAPCRSCSLAMLLAVVAGSAACSAGDDGPRLSPFQEGITITGRVVDNVTACTVDAVCYLRIELADTTIEAVYGDLGEAERQQVFADLRAYCATDTLALVRLYQELLVRCG